MFGRDRSFYDIFKILHNGKTQNLGHCENWQEQLRQSIGKYVYLPTTAFSAPVFKNKSLVFEPLNNFYYGIFPYIPVQVKSILFLPGTEPHFEELEIPNIGPVYYCLPNKLKDVLYTTNETFFHENEKGELETITYHNHNISNSPQFGHIDKDHDLILNKEAPPIITNFHNTTGYDDQRMDTLGFFLAHRMVQGQQEIEKYHEAKSNGKTKVILR